MVGNDEIDISEIRTHKQVTDSYLLALAVSRQGKLATFDHKLSVKSVRGGRRALQVIDAMVAR